MTGALHPGRERRFKNPICLHAGDVRSGAKCFLRSVNVYPLLSSLRVLADECLMGWVGMNGPATGVVKTVQI